MKNCLRLLTALLSAIFIFSSLPFSASATQNTWNPDSGVYDISTEQDFLSFRDYYENDNYFDNLTVNILNDLDFTGMADYSAPSALSSEFHGTINGNGHAIKNINIVSTDGYQASLFTSLAGNACIKDLDIENLVIKTGSRWNAAFAAFVCGDTAIENCHIKGNSVIQSVADFRARTINYAAGFVGDLQGGTLTFDNCTVEEDVVICGRGETTNNEGGRMAAGFVASVSSYEENIHCIIKNCVNYADITSDVVAGGFVAYANPTSENHNQLSIYNSINYGNISAGQNYSNGAQMAGGLIAHSNSHCTTDIDCCANIGNITVYNRSSNDCGGLVAYANDCIIYNSYNAGTITGTNVNVIGGIVGHYRTNTTGVPYYSGGTEVIYYPEQFNGIFNCYNVGNVVGGNSNYIGGICGYIQEASTDMGNFKMYITLALLQVPISQILYTIQNA